MSKTSGNHRPPPPPDDAPPQGGKGGKGPDMAQVLVTMAEETYRFIRADDGRTYGVPKDGPNIAVPLGSKGEGGVRAKLATSLWRRSGQVASGAALSDCVNVLEGEAGEKDPEPVFLRMGRLHDPELGECVVVDMGTETGQAIVVTCDGWRTEAKSPVIFRRSSLVHPLVEPVHGGSLNTLRALVNLSEEDYRLAIGWVVAAFFLDIPHPILFVQGEQGTAKSTLVRTLLSLCDPQPAADRETPAGSREWAIFARASWAFSFDNLTEIPDWFSNSLCKGVTGDSVLQRALHSDEDIVVFSFQRVMAITTIGIKHALAGDLVDRMLLVEPEVLDSRRPESEIRAAREAALPEALGAILDLVCGTLAHLPNVQIENLPRMADFARVLAALDAHTGWSTLATYRERIVAMGASLIEGDVFAQSLYRLAHRPNPDGPPPGPWEGSTADLLAELHKICVQGGMAVTELPKDVRVAGQKVTEVAPSLRKLGVDVRRRKSGSKRFVSVSKITS
ncbi:ATP-binding protein [Actinocorallia libanotica]|uniref:ATP-binding protein n=1 Tax=Actinocorallia libanotica TaxID=46162 RepID=A0ABP4CGI1_9ACTN